MYSVELLQMAASSIVIVATISNGCQETSFKISFIILIKISEGVTKNEIHHEVKISEVVTKRSYQK